MSKNITILVEYLILLTFFNSCVCNNEFCYTESDCNSSPEQAKYSNRRYILYDVNPYEGFNLRRDVYMRIATLAHKLKLSKNEKLNNFKIVLPPWSRIVHWRRINAPEKLPWGHFFDVDSLKKFAPVMEMYEFFQEFRSKQKNTIVIDEVYVLQSPDLSGESLEDVMKIEPCKKEKNHHNIVNFSFYNNFTSENIKCLTFLGSATKLIGIVEESHSKTFFIDRAETALHDLYGNSIYWQARRSMRFNTKLKELADEFREQHLGSNDATDSTILPMDWRLEKPRRTAKGGPYLAVHLRRKDFARARSKEIPSVTNTVKQIAEALEKLDRDNNNNITTVFIATDSDPEYQEIKHYLTLIGVDATRYSPSDETLDNYGDGGVAIIDQIICSYARHFIGTAESTFTFRIQEEREIIGFPVETTFNVFCSDFECRKPSIWKIVY